MSEVMTILIWFHQPHYRDFKAFYQEYVCQHLRPEFPNLVSYNRFVELMAGTLLTLWVYLSLRRGRTSGIAFVDSTPISVCPTSGSDVTRHFADLARRGKSTIGYFYGFKLDQVVNDQGEILAFCLTLGNVDDRVSVPTLARELWGKLVGDKGYISQALFDQLFGHDLRLITTARKNMKTG